MLRWILELFSKPARPELPQVLDSATYEALMPTTDAFPRPEWDKIRAKIDKEHSLNQVQAWQDIAHIWLTRLSYRLEGGYHVQRSDEFILLSSLSPRRAGFVLEILEGIRKRLLETVGWTKADELDGLYTVLLFRNSKEYLQYVCAFGAEGEDELSIGIYLNKGYGHMVIVEAEIWRLEATLAHILSHYVLAHSSLPHWLQVGLCLHMAEVYQQGDLITELKDHAALAEQRRDFWVKNGIGGFWSGKAFHRGNARERADDLALNLTRLVLEEAKRPKLLLKSIDWRDAGFQAVKEETGRELGTILSELIGPGDWDFVAPDDWAELSTMPE